MYHPNFFFPKQHGLLAALFILTLLVSLSTTLQAQEVIWAKRAGGPGGEFGSSIVVDGAGNTYVTGLYSSPATFGPGEANETTLSGTQGEIFVAKYDVSGALVWVKHAGGPSQLEVGQSIAIDNAGNSYVTGFFTGSTTFGPGEANQTFLSGIGEEIFIAKFDGSGALIWAKRAGGSGSDRSAHITIDGAGNSYVTGSFTSSATFGPGEANQTILSGAGQEIFVAKYDVNGLLVWTKRAGGFSFDYGNGIAIDASGNSYVTGKFTGSATFGAGEPNQTTLTGGDTFFGDIFVAKYNGSGALVWAKKAGGASGDVGTKIALDGTGNIYVTGLFISAPAIFGSGEPNQTTLFAGGGSSQIFVAKHDGSSGALVWAKSAGGAANDTGNDIVTDAAGNSYIVGNFDGSATFGAGEANETILSGNSGQVFVAKYAVNGSLAWARNAGGAGNTQGFGIAVDGAGYSYITGLFLNFSTFGNITLNSTDGVFDNDIFVAKFSKLAPVNPFVLLANTITLKQTKQITPAGDIHSNGVLTAEKGSPSEYFSNLTAVGKITINKENTITGNVTSPIAITNLGTVNGTITVGPVATKPLPSKSYSAGGPNATVPGGGSLTLAPGSYNLITLNNGGTLKLSSGDYFMNELLYLGSQGVIEIDLSSGNPATVNVVANLQLGKEAAIKLLPNGESDSEFVTFNTLQSTAASIGKEAYFLGSLIAPNASVTLLRNSQLRGSICANEIIVERDCLFLHHYSPGSLPGQGNLPKSSEDDSDESIVIRYQLEQNYPNPFNPSTTIRFVLPEAGEVSLRIYNMNGQLVREVVHGQYESGQHSVVWDGKDAHGLPITSGVYIYKLKAAEFMAQKKLLLMK